MTPFEFEFQLTALALTAFLASGMAFFTGFGLGTLLMPAFLFFFPLEIAISMTALVHLVSNVARFGMMRQYADRRLLIEFGIPSVIFAAVGAWALSTFSHVRFPLYIYSWGSQIFVITASSFIIGLVVVLFSLLELIPGTNKISLPRAFLSLGGALSGFFGGLSGHQGALRSLFLLRLKLKTEVFIGTTTVIACAVDLVRIFFYSKEFSFELIRNRSVPFTLTLGIALIAALSGNIVAKRLLPRTAGLVVKKLISVVILIFGFALCAGLIDKS